MEQKERKSSISLELRKQFESTLDSIDLEKVNVDKDFLWNVIEQTTSNLRKQAKTLKYRQTSPNLDYKDGSHDRNNNENPNADTNITIKFDRQESDLDGMDDIIQDILSDVKSPSGTPYESHNSKENIDIESSSHDEENSHESNPSVNYHASDGVSNSNSSSEDIDVDETGVIEQEDVTPPPTQPANENMQDDVNIADDNADNGDQDKQQQQQRQDSKEAEEKNGDVNGRDINIHHSEEFAAKLQSLMSPKQFSGSVNHYTSNSCSDIDFNEKNLRKNNTRLNNLNMNMNGQQHIRNMSDNNSNGYERDHGHLQLRHSRTMSRLSNVSVDDILEAKLTEKLRANMNENDDINNNEICLNWFDFGNKYKMEKMQDESNLYSHATLFLVVANELTIYKKPFKRKSKHISNINNNDESNVYRQRRKISVIPPELNHHHAHLSRGISISMDRSALESNNAQSHHPHRDHQHQRHHREQSRITEYGNIAGICQQYDVILLALNIRDYTTENYVRCLLPLNGWVYLKQETIDEWVKHPSGSQMTVPMFDDFDYYQTLNQQVINKRHKVGHSMDDSRLSQLSTHMHYTYGLSNNNSNEMPSADDHHGTISTIQMTHGKQQSQESSDGDGNAGTNNTVIAIARKHNMAKHLGGVAESQFRLASTPETVDTDHIDNLREDNANVGNYNEAGAVSISARGHIAVPSNSQYQYQYPHSYQNSYQLRKTNSRSRRERHSHGHLTQRSISISGMWSGHNHARDSERNSNIYSHSTLSHGSNYDYDIVPLLNPLPKQLFTQDTEQQQDKDKHKDKDTDKDWKNNEHDSDSEVQQTPSVKDLSEQRPSPTPQLPTSNKHINDKKKLHKQEKKSSKMVSKCKSFIESLIFWFRSNPYFPGLLIVLIQAGIEICIFFDVITDLIVAGSLYNRDKNEMQTEAILLFGWIMLLIIGAYMAAWYSAYLSIQSDIEDYVLKLEHVIIENDKKHEIQVEIDLTIGTTAKQRIKEESMKQDSNSIQKRKLSVIDNLQKLENKMNANRYCANCMIKCEIICWKIVSVLIGIMPIGVVMLMLNDGYHVWEFGLYRPVIYIFGQGGAKLCFWVCPPCYNCCCSCIPVYDKQNNGAAPNGYSYNYSSGYTAGSNSDDTDDNARGNKSSLCAKLCTLRTISYQELGYWKLRRVSEVFAESVPQSFTMFGVLLFANANNLSERLDVDEFSVSVALLSSFIVLVFWVCVLIFESKQNGMKFVEYITIVFQGSFRFIPFLPAIERGKKTGIQVNWTNYRLVDDSISMVNKALFSPKCALKSLKLSMYTIEKLNRSSCKFLGKAIAQFNQHNDEASNIGNNNNEKPYLELILTRSEADLRKLFQIYGIERDHVSLNFEEFARVCLVLRKRVHHTSLSFYVISKLYWDLCSTRQTKASGKGNEPNSKNSQAIANGTKESKEKKENAHDHCVWLLDLLVKRAGSKQRIPILDYEHPLLHAVECNNIELVTLLINSKYHELSPLTQIEYKQCIVDSIKQHKYQIAMALCENKGIPIIIEILGCSTLDTAKVSNTLKKRYEYESKHKSGNIKIRYESESSTDSEDGNNNDKNQIEKKDAKLNIFNPTVGITINDKYQKYTSTIQGLMLDKLQHSQNQFQLQNSEHEVVDANGGSGYYSRRKKIVKKRHSLFEWQRGNKLLFILPFKLVDSILKRTNVPSLNTFYSHSSIPFYEQYGKLKQARQNLAQYQRALNSNYLGMHQIFAANMNSGHGIQGDIPKYLRNRSRNPTKIGKEFESTVLFRIQQELDTNSDNGVDNNQDKGKNKDVNGETNQTDMADKPVNPFKAAFSMDVLTIQSDIEFDSTTYGASDADTDVDHDRDPGTGGGAGVFSPPYPMGARARGRSNTIGSEQRPYGTLHEDDMQLVGGGGKRKLPGLGLTHTNENSVSGAADRGEIDEFGKGFTVRLENNMSTISTIVSLDPHMFESIASGMGTGYTPNTNTKSFISPQSDIQNINVNVNENGKKQTEEKKDSSVSKDMNNNKNVNTNTNKKKNKRVQFEDENDKYTSFNRKDTGKLSIFVKLFHTPNDQNNEKEYIGLGKIKINMAELKQAADKKDDHFHRALRLRARHRRNRKSRSDSKAPTLSELKQDSMFSALNTYSKSENYCQLKMKEYVSPTIKKNQSVDRRQFLKRQKGRHKTKKRKFIMINTAELSMKAYLNLLAVYARYGKEFCDL